MTISSEQRALLQQARLRGLVRARWPEVDPVVSAYPNGAAGTGDATAWVLAADTGERAAGGALTWAVAKGCDRLHLLVEDHAPLLARVVSRFSLDTSVWAVDGTALTAVAPAPAPERATIVGPPVDEVGAPVAEVDRLRDAGLELVVEDDVLHVEVLGLEVGRWSADAEGVRRLESGVGRFDREMSALMYSQMAPVEAVLSAAEFVAQHRRPGAPPHPLRDLGRERWLRASLLADPSPLGLHALRPIGTTLPRPNLRDPWPAVALGTGEAGPVVVVCVAGIDLDAVPLAADTAAVVAPGAELVVAGVEPLPRAVAAVLDRVEGPTRSVVVVAPWAGDGGR